MKFLHMGKESMYKDKTVSGDLHRCFFINGFDKLDVEFVKVSLEGRCFLSDLYDAVQ